MMSGQGGAFSLFKASPFGSAVVKPQADDDDDDSEADFFSRSEQTYALIAAKDQERKKRKAVEAEQHGDEPKSAEPGSGKKQRTEVLDFESSIRASSEPSSPTAQPDEHLVNTGSPPDLAHESRPVHPVIDLDDSQSETSSLEEISEQHMPAVSGGEPGQGGGPSSSQAEVFLEEAPAVEPPRKASPTPDPELNTIVTILITSAIPETSALRIQRRSGQRLKEARLEWCNRQQFDGERTADIVLTWHGKQVYDSTSCYGLGIRVNAAGEVIHEGDMDVIANTDGQIHMEAMTRKMLLELKKSKTAAKVAVKLEAAPPETLPPASAPEKRVRLILKSKDRDDLKLGVREVSELITCHGISTYIIV